MMLGTLQPKMPPSGGGLKQVDIDKIRLWIDAGAKMDTTTEATPATGKQPGAVPANKLPSAPVTASGPIGKVLAVAAPVTALAFSPDSKTLAVGTYREVQLWNAETRQLAGVWTGHADAVRSLVYSKDGKWLVAGGGAPGVAGEARVWDVIAGREVRSFGGEHTDTINSVALSPDATKAVTGSVDKTLKVWEMATGKCVNTLRDHADAVWAVAWSPDGKYLASASSDRSIKVWDAPTGKRRYSVSAHNDVIDSLEFSPDGSQLLSASADGTARSWYFGADGSNAARTFGGHGGPVLAASYCGETNTVATASGDKTVRIWVDGSTTRTLKEPKDWVYAVRMSPDKKRIAAGTWDGAILFWNATDGKVEGQTTTLRGGTK
jgi:WD40 repeat protein